MNCKNAVCYVGGNTPTNRPVFHTGHVPTIRIQEYAAHAFAKKADIPISEHFCDIGENIDRLTAPSFTKMLNYLTAYRKQNEIPCLVIIHSEVCVSRDRQEFAAISKAISDAGGVLALSHVVDETVQ